MARATTGRLTARATARAAPRSREEADRKHDAMQNMASRPESLPDDLAHQLGFLDCDATIRALAEYIIYNLDENGFLKPTLYDLVRDYAGDVTIDDAERALRLVQRLDPPGIAARNLQGVPAPPARRPTCRSARSSRP